MPAEEARGFDIPLPENQTNDPIELARLFDDLVEKLLLNDPTLIRDRVIERLSL